MAIAVFRVLALRDNDFVIDGPVPTRSVFRHGDVAAVLSQMPPRGDSPLGWTIPVEIGSGKAMRRHRLPIEAFLTLGEYQESQSAPFSFNRLIPLIGALPAKLGDLRWLWLYRDTLYVTEREPRPSEDDEVILRIKALHFQRHKGLTRLREQVANFEAVEGNLSAVTGRKAIPDDVKLLVWSRDRGACVRCGAAKNLHFDHIIPLSRGGADVAENLQILCSACNLSKGCRIV